MVNEVGKTTIGGEQWIAGVAYITVPSDVERSVYIRDCYLNSKLSIWSEDAGFLNRVPTSEDVMNFVDFPPKTGELGTAVVFVTEPIHKQPIIIARLNKIDELGELKEGTFKFKRKLKNSLVEISGGNKGCLNLIVESTDEAEININVISKSSKGKLRINVDGTFYVESSSLNVTTSEEIFQEVIGEEEQSSCKQTSREYEIEAGRFTFNQGENPVTLGSELQDFLSQFIEKVSAITVASPTGPLPLVDTTSILLLKKDLSKIISTEFFIKK